MQHADSQKFLTYLQEQAETKLSSAIDEVGKLRTQFLSGGGRAGNTDDEQELRHAFSKFVDAAEAASLRLQQLPEQSRSPAAGSSEQSGLSAAASLEQTGSPAGAPTGLLADASLTGAPTGLLADASLTGPGGAPVIASQPDTNALLASLVTGQQQLVQQNQMMMGFMACQQQQFHQLAGAFGAQIQHPAPISLVHPIGHHGAAQAPMLQLQPMAQPMTQPMAQPVMQPMAQSTMQPLLQMAPFAHPVSMQHSSGALPAEAQLAQPSALMQTPTNPRPNQQQSVTPSLTLNFGPGNPFGT